MKISVLGAPVCRCFLLHVSKLGLGPPRGEAAGKSGAGREQHPAGSPAQPALCSTHGLAPPASLFSATLALAAPRPPDALLREGPIRRLTTFPAKAGHSLLTEAVTDIKHTVLDLSTKRPLK